MEVNGTLMWYYMICKREVWPGRNIVPDQKIQILILAGLFMGHLILEIKRNRIR